MNKRLPDYIIVILMFPAGGYVLYSGIIMDFYGSESFLYHKLVGYIISGLIFIHIALNWVKMKSFFQGFFRKFNSSDNRPSNSRPTSTTPPASQQRPNAPASPPPTRQPVQPPTRQQVLKPRNGRRYAIAAIGSAAAGFIVGKKFSAQNSACLDRDPFEDGSIEVGWQKSLFPTLHAQKFDYTGKRDRFKVYKNVRKIPLPSPRDTMGGSLLTLVGKRRSFRDFTKKPVSLADVADVLFCAQGITEPDRGYRAVPSAGALYPLEIYMVANRVTGLTEGLYHYQVSNHSLEFLNKGKLAGDLMEAGIGQELLGNCAAGFVISAVFFRTQRKYKRQSYRYILLEAGHAAQNMLLAAANLNLGSATVGSIRDNKVSNLIKVKDDDTEKGLYLVAIGQKS